MICFSVRCLAVGTTNGIVAIWKYTGIFRDVSKTSDVTSISASDWKVTKRICIDTLFIFPFHELL
jgi:hypothetical protein